MQINIQNAEQRLSNISCPTHNKVCEVKVEQIVQENYSLKFTPCCDEQKENIQKHFTDIITEAVADYGLKFITDSFH